MEVLRVFVQDQSAKLLHGELVPRPDLGDIKGVEAKLIGICLVGLHHLHVRSPFNILATLNRIPEIALGLVRVSAAHGNGFLVGERLLSVLGNEVILDVDEFAVLIHPLEGMAAISMVEAPALRSSMVAEKHEARVVGLWGIGKQVEQGIKVQKEVPGVAALRANHIGALNGISTEEGWLYKGQLKQSKSNPLLVLTKLRPTMS